LRERVWKKRGERVMVTTFFMRHDRQSENRGKNEFSIWNNFTII